MAGRACSSSAATGKGTQDLTESKVVKWFETQKIGLLDQDRMRMDRIVATGDQARWRRAWACWMSVDCTVRLRVIDRRDRGVVRSMA